MSNENTILALMDSIGDKLDRASQGKYKPKKVVKYYPTKRYRILRDIDKYKTGDIIKQLYLPATFLVKVRKELVILHYINGFQLDTFEIINNPNEFKGYFVERIE